MKQSKLKIDVGGGLYPKKGYINVDPYYPKADVKDFMWDLHYGTGTVDEVHCSHALEHIGKKMILSALREFYRVLVPGGLLVLEVPDLRWCCENWLKNPDAGWNLDAIFGNQDDQGQFHLTGFSYEILLDYVTRAGFTNRVAYSTPWTHNQKCLHFEIFK